MGWDRGISWDLRETLSLMHSAAFERQNQARKSKAKRERIQGISYKKREDKYLSSYKHHGLKFCDNNKCKIVYGHSVCYLLTIFEIEARRYFNDCNKLAYNSTCHSGSRGPRHFEF